jgi:hypothetical protein
MASLGAITASSSATSPRCLWCGGGGRSPA